MTYHDVVEGTDVWVTVIKPKVKSNDGLGYSESLQWCSAFKFDSPGMTDGEYVRSQEEGNPIQWFDSADKAADAAFGCARHKLTGTSRASTTS